MKRILLLILVVIYYLNGWGQYYNTGVEPYSVKWKTLSTERFKILFPADAEKAAIKFANLLDTVNIFSSSEFSLPLRKMNIVIHNHSILSNGYVAWAPNRMEIITHQPTTTNAQPWLKQLATHETRHYAQLSNLKYGVFSPLNFIFGEQAIGAAAGFIPIWFLEGDAVAFETGTSNSGRGRQADFYNYYRAHYLSNSKPFKYDKWLLGSYKENIPDHYSLGYQMVTFGKLKYNNNIWANTLKYSTRYPFTLFPFYFGLKKETGVSRKTLHYETFKFLDSLWTKNITKDSFTHVIQLSKRNQEYTDYRYSRQLNDSTIISYKTSLSRIPAFVKIDLKKGSESRLFNPGYLTSRPSIYDGKIYYCEYKPHPRWEMMDYSVIKLYQMENNTIETISEAGKFFSPAYNPDKKCLYAINRSEDGKNKLVQINDSVGVVEIALFPEQFDPFELWVSDSGRVYVGVVSDNGKSILEFNEGDFQSVFGPTYLDINSFSAYENLIFFNLSLNYNENIFCYNKLNNRFYEIVNTTFGSKDPIYLPKTNSLIFSSYSDKGYNISVAEFDTTGKSLFLPYRNDDAFTRFLDSIELLNIDTFTVVNKNYKVEEYRGIGTLINIHSWIPFFAKQSNIQLNESPLMLGATLLSQNLTGSSTLIVGYGYNNNHNLLISYQYDGFWPKLRLNLESYEINGHAKGVNKLSASIMAPFTNMNEHFSSYFLPILTTTYTNETFYSLNNSSRYIQYLEVQEYYSLIERMAKRDLRPRLGIIVDLKYKTTPFENRSFGDLFALQSKVFLPGIFTNHSLMTSITMQKQWYKQFLYTNTMSFPRGFNNFQSSCFKAFSVDYIFPLFYPDLPVRSIAYIKRLSANLFIDIAKNQYPTNINNTIHEIEYGLRSFGFDLYIDFHLFRTRFPLKFKIQQGWRGKEAAPFTNFSLVTDIYGAFGNRSLPRSLFY